MKYLVKIDLSGIQDFIFDVKSKSASKSLKTKSLYVILLTDVIIKYFQDEFSNCEILYNGGGNAYIIITSENTKTIFRLISEISKKNLIGLKVIISVEEMKSGRFTDIMNAVNKRANETKYHKLIDFEPFEKLQSFEWETLSNLFLVNSGYVISKEPPLSHLDILDYSITFSPSCKQLQNHPIKILPKDSHENTLDFDKIANMAYIETGTEYLGSLKIDVDNLGKLFESLTQKEQFETLAKKIEYFFSSKISKLINEKYFNKIYVVFSGGDDCFIIGPWNDILLLAIDIRDSFENYKKDELANTDYINDLKYDKTTLSASVIIIQPNYPMIRLADLAENELHKAKMEDEDKDKISVFGYVLTWKDFKRAMAVAYQLTDLVQNRGESRAIIQRIEKSYIGYTFLQKRALDGKINVPEVWRLKYYLRNVKKENFIEIDKLFNEYTEALMNAFQNKKVSNPNLFIVAARWAEYLTKSNIEGVKDELYV